MKMFLAFCCSLIAVGTVNPVVAGPLERETGFGPSVQNQGSRIAPQREADRPVPQRETRKPGEADRGRMSADERRQLRRDIHDVGKDVYQRERQAPGGEQRR